MKKNRIITKICIIIIVMLMTMCDNNDTKSIKYDTLGKYQFYNVLEENMDGLITPKYNYIDKNYNGLNPGSKAYFYNFDKTYLKSFLAFPEKYNNKTFISFSDDTISIKNYLIITIFDKANIYKIYHRNNNIVNNQEFGSIKLYFIPANRIGKDTIKIKEESTDKYINFIFHITEQNIPRKDSILFYSTFSSDLIDTETLKQILKSQ